MTLRTLASWLAVFAMIGALAVLSSVQAANPAAWTLYR